MRLTFAPFILALSLAASSAQAQTDDAVRAELAAVADAFSRAYVAGEAEAIAALYTDDAVLIPHNDRDVRGLEAIEAYWTPREGATVEHHRITPTRVEVFGDVATDYGTYVAHGTDGGRAWGPSHGNYLTVWKRGADGRWRMQLDMWNGRPAPDDAR